jgi:hypothetical protein
MSSASVPAPRSTPPSASRHSLFWPFFVLLIGIGAQSIYQTMAMEDHLDEVTRALDKMDSQVKLSQHERLKFYALARDVLYLAPTDPIAEKITQKFKLREMRAAQPALFDAPSTVSTNAAPVQPLSTSTTTAPMSTGTTPVH